MIIYFYGGKGAPILVESMIKGEKAAS